MTMYLIMYVYVCIDMYVCVYKYIYVSLCMPCISEKNDSNDSRDGRGELGLFCCYVLLTLLAKWYSVIRM